MNSGYYIIFDWMIDGLGLEGKEVDVYAIIYGFSQDGESWFHGSKKYLAHKARCCENTLTKALKSLKEKGLIKSRKFEMVDGVYMFDYAADLSKIGNADTTLNSGEGGFIFGTPHTKNTTAYNNKEKKEEQNATVPVDTFENKTKNRTELNKQRTRKQSIPKPPKDIDVIATFEELWTNIPLREKLESGQTHDEQLCWSAPCLVRIKEDSAASWDELRRELKRVFGGKGYRNISYWLQDSADSIIESIRKEHELWNKLNAKR